MATRLLEKQEELTLARQWLDEGSERARAKLVAAYQPMVRRLARKYMRSGLSIEDLIQEGVIGFMAGLDNFDPDRGYSVGTLARFHISARLQLHVSEFTGIIRLPNSRRIKGLLSGCVSKIRLEEKLREAALTNAEKEKICIEAGFSLSELEQYEMVMRPTKSISSQSTSDDGESGFDLVDENGSPEDIVAQDQSMAFARRVMAEILSDFPERTRRIVSMRYLSDGFVSLDQIAAVVGVSRERVRRIEKDALAEIRKRFAAAGIEKLSEVV